MNFFGVTVRQSRQRPHGLGVGRAGTLPYAFIKHQARSARHAVIRAVAWGRRLVQGVRTIETAAGNGGAA